MLLLTLTVSSGFPQSAFSCDLSLLEKDLPIYSSVLLTSDFLTRGKASPQVGGREEVGACGQWVAMDCPCLLLMAGCCSQAAGAVAPCHFSLMPE